VLRITWRRLTRDGDAVAAQVARLLVEAPPDTLRR
jgi:hypothetical protein